MAAVLVLGLDELCVRVRARARREEEEKKSEGARVGRGRAARGVPPSFFVHSLLALEGEPLGRADGASPSVPI